MSVREVRGVATDAAGNPLNGALVECSLNTDACNDNWQILPVVLTRVTDSAGNFTLELESNTDPTLLPTGSSYLVRITSGDVVSEYSIVVTDAAYEAGQTWFDFADVLVGIPPIVGPVSTGPMGPAGPALRVADAGSLLPFEPEVDFIPGTSIAVTAVDNPGAARTEVTIGLGPVAESQVTGLVADLAANAAAIAAEAARAEGVEASLATTAYVNAVAQGLSVKASVKALAAANVALSGLQTIDGYTTLAGDRVLLTAQSVASQNGIWQAFAGAWTRPLDFGTGANAQGTFVFVEGGGIYAASGFVEASASAVTIDTNPQTWTQFSGAGEITAGSGLTKNGNQLSVTPSTFDAFGAATAEAARAQAAEALLGLVPTSVKTAAYTIAPQDFVPVDTTSGNVALTLPTAPADKTRVAVKMVIQGAANTVSITCGGFDVLNRAGGPTVATLSMLSQAISLQYSHAAGIWYVVNDDLPLSQTDARYARNRQIQYMDQTALLYLGTADSATIFNACLSALPTLAADGYKYGVIEFGVGQYLINGATNNPGPHVLIRGQDTFGTYINYTGNGDCFWAYSNQFSMGNPSLQAAYGGGIEKLTIDGTGAGANANGYHFGDMQEAKVLDVCIQNFTGANANGILEDNHISWTEKARVRAMLYNNTTDYHITCSAGPSTTVHTTVVLPAASVVINSLPPDAPVPYNVVAGGLTPTIYGDGTSFGYSGITNNGDGTYTLTGCTGGTGTLTAGDTLTWGSSGASHAYGDRDLTLYVAGNQNAFVVDAGANPYSSALRLRGNFSSTVAANSSVCVSINGAKAANTRLAGTVSLMQFCHMDIQVETSGPGTNAPQTFNCGAGNAINACYGILRFGGTWTPANTSLQVSGRMQFFGYVLGDANLNPAAPHGAQTYVPISTGAIGYFQGTLPNTGASAGNISPSSGDFFSCRLQQNLTIQFGGTASQYYAGPQRKVFIIQQALSGGPYTLTWPTSATPTTANPTVLWAGGVAPLMSTGAGATDVYLLESIDGATWFGYPIQATPQIVLPYAEFTYGIGTYVIPVTGTWELGAMGGGGKGGNGGVAASTAVAAVGGSSGAAGTVSKRKIYLQAGTVITYTVGAGGAPSTWTIGGPVWVKGNRGSDGLNGASGTASVGGGVYGATPNTQSTTPTGPGSGGLAGSAQGGAGGEPAAEACGGSSGGAPAQINGLGGLGGNLGTVTDGGAPQSGNTATKDGGNPANPVTAVAATTFSPASTVVTMASTAGISIGMTVTDATTPGNIPHGCSVVSIIVNTSITLSAAPLGTSSGTDTLNCYFPGCPGPGGGAASNTGTGGVAGTGPSGAPGKVWATLL